MARIISSVVLVVALFLITLGCLVFLDGLLPFRSNGPNPPYWEVAIGGLLIFLGSVLRRVTLSWRKAGPSAHQALRGRTLCLVIFILTIGHIALHAQLPA